MKKKIALLLALVLTLSMLFALTSCDHKHKDKDGDYYCDKKNCDEWCGTVFSPEDVQTYVDDTIVYTSSNTTSLGEFAGYTVSKNNYNGLILFAKTESNSYSYSTRYLKVYNVETGSTVYSTSFSTNINDYNYANTTVEFTGEDFFIVSSSGVDKLYNANGSVVSPSETEDISRIGSNYYYFDDAIYLCEDGKATLVTKNPFIYVPDFSYVTDEYFYEIIENTDQTLDSIFIYNTECALVSEFVTPENALGAKGFHLNNGNMFIQYRVELPVDAAEYDIYEDEVKYDLVSAIFNVADGSVSCINFNYVVDYLFAYDEEEAEEMEDGVVVSYTNLVYMKEIVNKIVSNVTMIVDLDNDMHIAARFDQIIASQSGTATCIAEDRYVVGDRSGKEYLVDGAGEVIGEITNAEHIAGYLFKDGKFYDYDLEFVAEVPEGYSLVDFGNGYAIYSKSETYNYTTTYSYQIFKNGSFSSLYGMNNVSSVSVYDNFYVYSIFENNAYVTPTRKVCVYNVKGEPVAEYNNASDPIINSVGEDTYLLSYTLYNYDYNSTNYTIIK